MVWHNSYCAAHYYGEIEVLIVKSSIDSSSLGLFLEEKIWFLTKLKEGKCFHGPNYVSPNCYFSSECWDLSSCAAQISTTCAVQILSQILHILHFPLLMWIFLLFLKLEKLANYRISNLQCQSIVIKLLDVMAYGS